MPPETADSPAADNLPTPAPQAERSQARAWGSKGGRPSRRVLQGRRVWLGRLLAAGRLAEAERWAKRHRLPWPPPPAAAEHLPKAGTGGEGVSLDQPAANWDNTAPIGQNLQSAGAMADAPIPQNLQSPADELTPAVGAAVVAAALADPALAAGGGEGGLGVGVGAGAGGLADRGLVGEKREEIIMDTKYEHFMKKIPFDGMWGNFPNLQDGQVIGVIGRRCRNKWYVEVEVGEVWGKAEIGEWVVQPNEQVVVELVWESADGRDKEWRIVAKVQPAPLVEPEQVAVDNGRPVEEELASPVEQEHVGADDFMERARREAYAAYMR